MLYDQAKRGLTCAGGLLLCAVLATAPAVAEVVVVANKGDPDSMNKEQVSDVFMGKTSSPPGGPQQHHTINLKATPCARSFTQN